MADLLLKNIKKIYRMDPNRRDDAIWIKDGMIYSIGSSRQLPEISKKSSGGKIDVLDCTDLIVLPGFVESHTHLLFAGSRENELYMRAAGRSYLEILESGGGIHHTVSALRSASEEQLIKHGLRFLDKALAMGITTIEIKSGYGLDFENEKKMLVVINKLKKLHPVTIIPTYLVHSVPKNTERNKYIEEVAQRMIPEFRQYADWFDIFLEKKVFELEECERLVRKARDAAYHIGIHTNQMNDIGGVHLANDLGVRHVDHLEILSDEDAELIKQNQNLYSVFIPTAEGFVFSEHVGQIQKLLNVPDRIVLTSDFNPGSSPVLSPFFVMTYAILRYRASDPFLLLDSYTKNPSQMLFLEDRGKIEEGLRADMICLESDNFEQIPYWGTTHFIKYVIKDGQIIEK